MAELDPERAMELALDSPLPNMVGDTTRRIARTGTERGLQALEASLGKTENPDYIHTFREATDAFGPDQPISNKKIPERKTAKTTKLTLVTQQVAPVLGNG